MDFSLSSIFLQTSPILLYKKALFKFLDTFQRSVFKPNFQAQQCKSKKTHNIIHKSNQ